MLLFGQPKESAHYAGVFTRIMIPGLWMLCQTELLRRYLTTQGVLYIVVNSQIVTCALHPLWLYLLSNSSITGVAYATTLTYFLNFIMPILYITFKKSVVKEDSWH